MRKTLAPAAALLVVIAAAVAAAAAIPDANGVIHGCRNLKTGVLRVIDSDKGQTCTKDEAPLSWNQTGPQGPAGPAGPSSLTLVRARTTVSVEPGTFNQATATCPGGHVVTGGGIDIVGSNPGGANTALVERYSGPVFDGQGWTLGMTNTGDAPATFTVEAICAPGTSTQTTNG